MASVKEKPTMHIVNPKDPKDPKPQIANTDDVIANGWTPWADRHDPARLADIEAQEARENTDEKPKDDEKPAATKSEGGEETKDGESDGSAVDPKDVRKAPAPKKA